jgi:hypothetical protein
VYFHVKDVNQIASPWIREHMVHASFLVPTDYLHVVPAYLSLMKYALQRDKRTQWICFLTDSCAPLVSPAAFRRRFFSCYKETFMAWKPAWWDVNWVKRANLHQLPAEFRLANTPWFVLCRRDADLCLGYVKRHATKAKIIMDGPVANESLFAIVMYATRRLDKIRNEETTLADWTRMPNAMSPYLFEEDSEVNRAFLQKNRTTSTLFLRKVGPDFPLANYVDMTERKTREDGWIEWCIFLGEHKKHIMIGIISLSLVYYVFFGV